MRLLLWLGGPVLLGIWLFGAVPHGWGDDLLGLLVASAGPGNDLPVDPAGVDLVA